MNTLHGYAKDKIFYFLCISKIFDKLLYQKISYSIINRFMQFNYSLNINKKGINHSNSINLLRFKFQSSKLLLTSYYIQLMK